MGRSKVGVERGGGGGEVRVGERSGVERRWGEGGRWSKSSFSSSRHLWTSPYRDVAFHSTIKCASILKSFPA